MIDLNEAKVNADETARDARIARQTAAHAKVCEDIAKRAATEAYERCEPSQSSNRLDNTLSWPVTYDCEESAIQWITVARVKGMWDAAREYARTCERAARDTAGEAIVAARAYGEAEWNTAHDIG